jgi:hypothetical protein
MGFETEQIEVFSPEQKELFGRLMSYLSGGGMAPGGTYKFRSPKIINNAMSSFPEGNPWRGVSQSGNIPQLNTYQPQDRLQAYRQAAMLRGLGSRSYNNPTLNQGLMTPNRAARNTGGR